MGSCESTNPGGTHAAGGDSTERIAGVPGDQANATAGLGCGRGMPRGGPGGGSDAFEATDARGAFAVSGRVADPGAGGSGQRQLWATTADRDGHGALAGAPHPQLERRRLAAGLPAPQRFGGPAVLGCFLLGLSTGKVACALLPMLGERISAATVSNISKGLDVAVAAFHRRRMRQSYRGLVFDGVVAGQKDRCRCGAPARPGGAGHPPRSRRKEIIDLLARPRGRAPRPGRPSSTICIAGASAVRGWS